MTNLLLLCLVIFFQVVAFCEPPKDPSHGPLSFSQMIESTRSSVVKIYCETESFPHDHLSDGTGFFVNNDGIVVTANHVITMPDNSQCQRITIALPLHGFKDERGNSISQSFNELKTSVSAVDLAHDIAILKPETNPLGPSYRGGMDIVDMGKRVNIPLFDRASATIDEAPINGGYEIFVSGYPLDQPNLITASGYIATSGAVDFDIHNRVMLDVYWADIRVNPGNSGGPVFSKATGAVVGIVKAVAEAPADLDPQQLGHAYGFDQRSIQEGRPQVHPILYNSGITYIVPSKYIADLLKKSAIPFNEAH